MKFLDNIGLSYFWKKVDTTKLDKTVTPNVLYGTDEQGEQYEYDLASLNTPGTVQIYEASDKTDALLYSANNPDVFVFIAK